MILIHQEIRKELIKALKGLKSFHIRLQEIILNKLLY